MKTTLEHEPILSGWEKTQILFLTGVVLSLIGWTWETVFSYLINSPNDRGFLLLPVCPIYGFSLIFIDLIFGTPSHMHLFSKPILIEKPILRYTAYFLAAAGFSIVIELSTSFFFESVFGIRLWSYGFLNSTAFSDYIAPLSSLFWGFAITVFMRFLFEPLYRAIGKSKSGVLSILFWNLLVLLIADAVFNTVYVVQHGRHFDLPFFE